MQIVRTFFSAFTRSNTAVTRLALILLSLVLVLSSLSFHANAAAPSEPTSIKSSQLIDGDLLFVASVPAGLSGAINQSTQKQEDANFDHIGMLMLDGDKGFVLHAAPKGGSQKQPLADFLKEETQSGQQIVAYRLKAQYQPTIKPAIAKAQTLLGKPYNFTYILSDDEYYCSDFIERAFRKDHIFDMVAMNFKNLKTGKMPQYWQDFYAERGLEIPQGKPGTNPNDFAASDKLVRLGKIN